MSTVQEIEAAIRELSPSELAELRAFISEIAREKNVDSGMDAHLNAQREMLELQRQQSEALGQLREAQAAASPLRSSPREKSGDSGKHVPDPVVQPAKYQSLDEWLAAFKRLTESHKDITAIADDSRESIY